MRPSACKYSVCGRTEVTLETHAGLEPIPNTPSPPASSCPNTTCGVVSNPLFTPLTNRPKNGPCKVSMTMLQMPCVPFVPTNNVLAGSNLSKYICYVRLPTVPYCHYCQPSTTYHELR